MNVFFSVFIVTKISKISQKSGKFDNFTENKDGVARSLHLFASICVRRALTIDLVSTYTEENIVFVYSILDYETEKIS